MQSTAMLEIKQVLGGPYSSEQDALQQHNGVLPPDSMLLRGRSIGSQDRRGRGRGVLPGDAQFGGGRSGLALGRGHAWDATATPIRPTWVSS